MSLKTGVGAEGGIVVGVVGLWESRSDFQGRWETKGNLVFLVFHRPSFPQPSPALHGVFAERKLANSFCLARCIRRAAVSLSAWAMRPRASSLCPGLR